MMVREGLADGSVAGSLSTTGDVLRAAIQVIGLAENITIVSSFFLMIFPAAGLFVRRLRRGSRSDGGAAGGHRHLHGRQSPPSDRRGAARGDALVLHKGECEPSPGGESPAGDRNVQKEAAGHHRGWRSPAGYGDCAEGRSNRRLPAVRSRAEPMS